MKTKQKFDLLDYIEEGGCSAKLSAGKLSAYLTNLPVVEDPNLLVGIDTHDDAGVYKISEQIALIQTVDFFPPVCSDPYCFGQIAAANALSDVYAMGGKPLTALNLMMFPDDKIPPAIFSEILKGSFDKVTEAGAVIAGGHTINDNTLKYGLSVTGIIHPDKVITNSGAKPGDLLILTKALGTGIITAGKKLNAVPESLYSGALASMLLLNNSACDVMNKYRIKCATDITGFGLLGHILKLSIASKVSVVLYGRAIPLLEGAYGLADLGCIPGAVFRNQEFTDEFCSFNYTDYNIRVIMLDAQTSGGILMCVPYDMKDIILKDLKMKGMDHSSVIGEVISASEKNIYVN